MIPTQETISHEAAVRVVRAIHETLYWMGVDDPWGSETIEDVAQILNDEGFGPTDEYVKIRDGEI